MRSLIIGEIISTVLIFLSAMLIAIEMSAPGSIPLHNEGIIAFIGVALVPSLAMKVSWLAKNPPKTEYTNSYDCPDECKAAPHLKFSLSNMYRPRLPERGTSESAGYDLFSPRDTYYEITQGETLVIDTGVFADFPEGYQLEIRSKSGLSVKGLVVANSPGTIDSDYTKTLQVILYNQGRKVFEIPGGTKIAQAVFSKVIEHTVTGAVLKEDERIGGLGSTGV